MDASVENARQHADHYRSRGYQPLPSDPTRKKPLCKFAKYWETPAPAGLFDRFPTPNIQVMTGRHWGLAVLDLDGRDAVRYVEQRQGGWPALPRTWAVYHSNGGRDSRHYWFTLPRNFAPRRKSLLWGVWEPDANEGRGAWKKRSAVELLCDHSLIMAPPSIHPKTGNPYRFFKGCGPSDMDYPAMIPPWLLRVEPVRPPRPDVPAAPSLLQTFESQIETRVSRRSIDSRLVLDAIADKVSIAKGWGLRFASYDGPEGWCSVHDFNRDDSSPSAQFNRLSGRFWRPGEQTLSLFDLGVEMGVFRDWLECKDALARDYGIAG